MTTPYIPITDAEIAPDKPVKSSIAHRLRDNLLAVVEGDPAAPSINPAIISQGGAAADGSFINTTTISGFGWYDFDVMTITAPKTIPAATVIRVNGNARLSDVLTVSRMSLAAHTSQAQVDKESDALKALGFQRPPVGANSSTQGAGGSNGGNGGGNPSVAPVFTPAIDRSFLNRPWATRFQWVGGDGGFQGNGSGTNFGEPGGCLVMVIEGDFDCTGGTIDAGSNPVDNTGAGSQTPGSGSGGTIIIICTGTITGGTFKANSGAGLNGNFVGGGGAVYLIASAFVGTQTIDVTHSSTGTTAGATNGVSASIALTRDFIRTLISRWI